MPPATVTVVPLTLPRVLEWWRENKEKVPFPVRGEGYLQTFRGMEDFTVDKDTPSIRYIPAGVPARVTRHTKMVVNEEDVRSEFIPTGALHRYTRTENNARTNERVVVNWLDGFPQEGPYTGGIDEVDNFFYLTGHVNWLGREEDPFTRDFDIQFCPEPMNILSEDAISREIMWVPR